MDVWELAARETIRDLVARYAHAADRGRFDELASLFTDDGTLELPDGPPIVGPEAIHAFLDRVARTRSSAAAGPALRHHVASHRIMIEDQQSATGYAYFMVVTARGLDHWGRYADRYACRDGCWLFAARRVRVDGRTTSPGD